MNILGRLEADTKAVIKMAEDGAFAIYSKGVKLADGPSARALADWAFDSGAQSVVFDFDLKNMERVP